MLEPHLGQRQWCAKGIESDVPAGLPAPLPLGGASSWAETRVCQGDWAHCPRRSPCSSPSGWRRYGPTCRRWTNGSHMGICATVPGSSSSRGEGRATAEPGMVPSCAIMSPRWRQEGQCPWHSCVVITGNCAVLLPACVLHMSLHSRS